MKFKHYGKEYDTKEATEVFIYWDFNKKRFCIIGYFKTNDSSIEAGIDFPVEFLNAWEAEDYLKTLRVRREIK